MRRHSEPSPLSFPQGFSGNPGSCSSGPLFGGPCVGKTHGFPIKDVGNDSGGKMSGMTAGVLKMTGMTEGLKTSGMTEGGIVGARLPFCHSRRVPLCHSRRVLAGIHGLALLSFHSGGPVWEKPVDSRLKMSGMTEGENVGNDRVWIEDGWHDGGGLKMSGMTRGGTTGVLSGAGLP